ncbi:hypothetical protein [Lignipirellula cremea]|uniref:Uncharacterized protein n=1 Tax=Lignipirellula cremea TaxID=2528010 RepID=A0A518DP82_9BACT|nr:hypothetical protein [Lignipirellula cremea]QDU93636.1 hypothetical protein Pla8534_14160 [Lignipirellula cremea]
MRHNESVFDFAEWLTEPPSGGPLQMWCVGAGLSAVVGLYGLSCVVMQRATTLNLSRREIGEGLWLYLSGNPAITLGLLFTFIGLFIHFQWFWGNQPRLAPFHQIAKFVAAAGVVISLFAHIFTLLTET